MHSTARSEEHTSELQSQSNLVCRLLLEKKKTHHRVRTDRIDQFGKLTLRNAGRLHHIGIGRTHADTRVLVLIQHLNIPTIHAATGQLITQIAPVTTMAYKPRTAPKHNKKQKPKP